MKFFKYFPLFMFTILFSLNVYASEYNVSSTVTSPTGSGSTGGRYEGTELNGSTGPFKIGTRYNGTLTNIRFNIPVPSSIGSCYWTNMTYRITMYMATEDWRNRFGTVTVKAYGTNYSTSKVNYVSYKKIYFTFKIPSSESTCIDYVLVNLPSNGLFNPFTGETNWNLSKITLTDSVSSGSGSSGGGSVNPTPSPNTTQQIIDNQNENTSSIIENNNQNTQDIIDNNTENTQKVIDNQNELLGNKCPNLFGDYTIVNGWIYGTVMRVNENNGNRMAFIPIKPNTTYTITREILSSTFRVGEYTSIPTMTTSNVDYSLPKAIVENNGGRKITYTTGSTASYLIVHYGNVSEDTFITQQLQTIQVVEGTEEKSFCVYGSYGSKMDELNDTIKDDNIDDKTGFFTGFSDNDHGLTSIITIPLNTIQQLTNTSCVALSVPIPYTNRNISLPCMTEVYQEHIPTIFNLWQVVSFGIIAYFICIDIFKIVKGFKDPNEDKVEVLDL